MLFLEKEGFTQILEAERIEERFDIAIMSTKGMSVTAARMPADQLRMHPVDVVKDLRGRGYTLGSIRGAVGRWTMALTRGDAERYLAERRKGEAGAP